MSMTTAAMNEQHDDAAFARQFESYLEDAYPHLARMCQEYGQTADGAQASMQDRLDKAVNYMRQQREGLIGSEEKLNFALEYMRANPGCHYSAAEHYAEQQLNQIVTTKRAGEGTLTVNTRPDGYGTDISDRPPEEVPQEILDRWDRKAAAMRQIEEASQTQFADDDQPETIKRLIGSRRKLHRVEEYLRAIPNSSYEDAEAYALSDSVNPRSWARGWRR
jgi:hypothetical protein